MTKADRMPPCAWMNTKPLNSRMPYKLLVQELGFPPEDVNRSFKDSFAYFLKTA
jgi:hypothetical protein